MNNDLVNGLFEIVGSIFIFHNIITLLKDKQVKGVSVLSTLYFTSWGLWNLHFYPSLHQPISYYGAIALAMMNGIWVLLMIYYNFGIRYKAHD